MSVNKPVQRMIVGISGATGLVYAARALEALRSLNVETHLIVSRATELMRAYESALSRKAQTQGARRLDNPLWISG